jgi:hypothetical protein
MLLHIVIDSTRQVSPLLSESNKEIKIMNYSSKDLLLLAEGEEGEMVKLPSESMGQRAA